MLLETLEIVQQKTVVRKIKFRRGLNLIIDETPRENRRLSGNNVGKTTALRVIDFCLGGNPQNLYLDREFKHENSAISNYLRTSGAEARLRIASVTGRKIVVRRALDDSYRIVDDQSFSQKEFRSKLSSILFGVRADKPTLRQLTPKFVRIEPDSMNNVLHWLHAKSNRAEYEAVWAYLFGFEDAATLTLRQSSKKLRKKKQQQRTALRSRFAPAALKAVVDQLSREIDQIDRSIAGCEVGGVLDSEVTRLTSIRAQVRDINRERAILAAKINDLEVAKNEFTLAKSAVSVGDLHRLYAEVSELAGELAASFGQLQDFHNKMIESRVRFVETTIRELRNSQKELDTELAALANEEAAALRKATSLGAFSDLQKLHDERTALVATRAQRDALLTEQRNVEEEISTLDGEIANFDKEIQKQWQSVERRLDVFNSSFAAYSKKICNESLVLGGGISDKGIEFSVANVGANEGTGKKRSIVAAFDFAFVSMLDKMKYTTFPRFVVHDQIETIGLNQLETIFSIAESLTSGQYIVAVLQDRVEELDAILNPSIRLRLSKDNRFFGIP